MDLLIKLVECFNFSLFSVLFFSIVALICKYVKIRNRLAPGPFGLPYVGYFPFLRENFPKHMNRLAKRYGPVFRLSIGSSQLLILSSIESIKEAFSKPEFSSRPRSKLYDMFQGYGIININGPVWQNQRKFLITQLRLLGMKVFGPQNKKMEDNIMQELMPLLSTLKASKGESFNPDSFFALTTSNILSMVLMSRKFRKDDPLFNEMIRLNKEGFKLFAMADISSQVPLMKYIPAYGNAYNQLHQNFESLKTIVKSFVLEERKHFDPEEPAKDILTTYLLSEHDASMAGLEVSEEETNRQIIQVIMDLYSGGSETMRSCFNWTFLILLHHPEVCAKIQAELDAIVGRDRLPTIDDMLSLHYVRAAISEILRFATIIPLAMHSAVEDTTVDGHLVQKGTLVFANHYSCHNNPKLFPNPEKYIPERFIDNSGRYNKLNGFVPFGFGRRTCLAEVMAKSELFLLISSVLHSFNLENPNTSQLPDLQKVYTFSNNPKPYEIRFVPREDLPVEIDDSLSFYEKLD